MVVRDLVSSIARKLPYSSSIPGFIWEALDSSKVEKEEKAESFEDARDKIHSRILRMRLHNAEEEDESTLVTSASVDGDHSGNKDFDSQVDFKDVRVRQYLNEQNNKFNELINNNFDAYLKQQRFNEAERYEESIKIPLIKMKNKLWSFAKGKQSPEIRRFEDVDCPSLLDGSTTHVEPFLASLDAPTKKSLYAALVKEIGDPENYQSRNEHASNKIEAIMILMVKLLFVFLKLAVPTMHYVYMKALNNEMFIINERNLNKFLSYTLWLLQKVEKKLHHDTLPAAGERAGLDVMYYQVAADTKSFIRSNFNNPLVDYMLLKFAPEATPKYYSNPNYAQYFAPSSSDSESSQSSAAASNNSSVQETSLFLAAKQFLDQMDP